MIVLDTSAIIAILQREPEASLFRRTIGRAGTALVSTGTAVELAVVVSGRSKTLHEEANAFLQEPFVRIEPVTGEQAVMAFEAFPQWGKGRHPAALNFGDMFAYVLARERDLPLLFKGDDFARTDVRNALAEPSS